MAELAEGNQNTKDMFLYFLVMTTKGKGLSKAGLERHAQGQDLVVFFYLYRGSLKYVLLEY